MTDKLKKQLILNLPYLIFVYLFDKLCQGVRLAPGADASEKLLHIGQGFSAAFASLAPSFHLVALCVGAAGAVHSHDISCCGLNTLSVKQIHEAWQSALL